MYGMESVVGLLVVAVLFLAAIGAVVFVISDVVDARDPDVEVPHAIARTRPPR